MPDERASDLDDAAWERYARAVSELLGIALTPEQLPGVVLNLRRTAEAADLVLEAELGVEIEPASRFEP